MKSLWRVQALRRKVISIRHPEVAAQRPSKDERPNL